MLGTVLRKAGFEVLEAVDGQQALDMMLCENVQCVLLDLSMPVVNGEEVVRTLRTAPEYASLRHVPVLGVSGFPLSEEQVAEMGLSDMIAKPFDADEVCRWVSDACGQYL